MSLEKLTLLEGMSLPSWMNLLFTFVLIIAVRAVFVFYRRSSFLPPGPHGVPILGNALQITAKMPWFKLEEWARQFGPIFSLNIVGQRVIVLNTYKAAADLFDRRSTLYSDRYRLILAGEILTGGMLLPLMPYGPRFHRMRRIAHESFSPRAIEKYKDLQAREVNVTTKKMLDSPDAWIQHFQRHSAAVILSAVYAWPSLTKKDEDTLKQIDSVNTELSYAIAPGNSVVDIFPVLKYLPLSLAKWKRHAVDWNTSQTVLFKGFNQDVAEKMDADEAHCFVSDILRKRDQHDMTEEEEAWLSGVMFAAGAETVSPLLPVGLNYIRNVSLDYFLDNRGLDILLPGYGLYPDVMKKAQAQLDAVVGRDRVPTFADQEELPYILAIVKEVLRWRPILPLALPRMVHQDDWYEGYLIPKGTMIIPNVWAMNRDPDIFPDFDEFRPERHLDTVIEDTHTMGHTTFGFGRRICIGSHFANQTLYMTIVSILWACNIDRAVDPSSGKPIIPSKSEFVERGIVYGPVPFESRISERFPGARSLLDLVKTET